MESNVIAKHTFSWDDQARFAKLSGDYNPMHMDKTDARRTNAGAPVVHGVHAVLWALEHLCTNDYNIRSLNSLRVRFLNYVYIDREITLVVASKTDSITRVELRTDGLVGITMTLRFGARNKSKKEELCGNRNIENMVYDTARVLDIRNISGMKGRLSADYANTSYKTDFLNLVNALGIDCVTDISLLSTLVGMVCPGLFSIFTEFNINILECSQEKYGLEFDVKLAHEDLNVVQMSVKGRNVEGSVSAILRAKPVDSADMSQIIKNVQCNEFKGTKALIIGGSRGLGAVTAKIIAAGGGSVTISYSAGIKDADMVKKSINEYCGSEICRTIHYDAFSEQPSQFIEVNEDVTQYYHFASSKIFRQKSEIFSEKLFDEFNTVYIKAFYNVCKYLTSFNRTKRLAVFYPSSVAVESRPEGMTEYSMSKSAGEILCSDLSKFNGKIDILTKRLPRVLTDQTATVLNVESANALDVMLPIIREMHALEKAKTAEQAAN